MLLLIHHCCIKLNSTIDSYQTTNNAMYLMVALYLLLIGTICFVRETTYSIITHWTTNEIIISLL